MSEKSKKYRVPRRRGVPWALLAALSLAVYLLLTFDTGEYSIYIIVVTAAVVLLWLARFFRKKNISREYTDISSKLSTYYEERTEREDYN
ncbi:MAG: hypothetical protein KGD64_12820, partial [Candidatus Heimdallarchaeota archaeon]|nr:hypothetical protein [Candidatus Heimdallarchaeota archaeon]